MLLTEATEGGWGLWGRTQTNEELVAAVRAGDRPAGRMKPPKEEKEV